MIIYLNLFPVIFKIITIILSFKDDCNKENDYYYYYYNYKNDSCIKNNETPNKAEDSKRLKNYYVKNAYIVPIGIIVYLLLITLRSFVNSSLKWLMDLKYILTKNY